MKQQFLALQIKFDTLRLRSSLILYDSVFDVRKLKGLSINDVHNQGRGLYIADKGVSQKRAPKLFIAKTEDFSIIMVDNGEGGGWVRAMGAFADI